MLISWIKYCMSHSKALLWRRQGTNEGKQKDYSKRRFSDAFQNGMRCGAKFVKSVNRFASERNPLKKFIALPRRIGKWKCWGFRVRTLNKINWFRATFALKRRCQEIFVLFILCIISKLDQNLTIRTPI